MAHRSKKEGIGRTLIVASIVALLCSVLVTGVSLGLKPIQERNEYEYRHQNILRVAGLYDPSQPVSEQFQRVQPRVVDLQTGEYVDDIDPADVEPVEADPGVAVNIPPEDDIAGIRQRPRFVEIYLVREDERVTAIILPVYGAGLWSTMYGFLALEPDGNTIRALRFYEHAETPGLGDEVDNEDWLDQWEGKLVFNEEGAPRIEVIRGKVPAGGPNERYQIDGMAGATLTGRGVTQLLRYWLGPNAFGPWLEKHWRGDS